MRNFGIEFQYKITKIKRSANMAKVFIIEGEKLSGKTTRCKLFAEELKKQQIKVGGFIAPGTILFGKRDKIYIENVNNHEKIVFAQREEQNNWQLIQQFYFNPEAIKRGEKWLIEDSMQAEYLFIDEIGLFDIQAKLWGPVFQKLLATHLKIVVCMRDKFVQQIISHFEIKEYKITECLEDLF